MSTKTIKLALEAAYLAGFNASAEGYNGEYGVDYPEQDNVWVKDRDNYVSKALAEQQSLKQEKSA